MPCRNALWVTLLLGMSAACVAAEKSVVAEKIAPALDPASDARAEFRELAEQIASSRDWFARVAEQTLDRQALILPEDRDPLDVVLRRSEALLADLRAAGPRYDLTADSAALADARQQAAKLKPAADGDGPRYELYLKVCQLRRRIALANPLLDFDKILFVQRHLSANHMCDQFYGHLNKKGGGLFVLDNAFSETPVARDLLAGAVVEKGRLAGKPLVPGSFLSPELSFDGRTVLFAYTQLAGRGWSPESCFHIFRVGADGKGLVQLTDGAWNEFDPCFLPDGRIAFISERRGGFLRCSGARPCPVYTLYSMDADGQDITRMSHHETHEWQPSVDNDGKIVYTRWDYVDRDFNVAHHMWTCLPDGRDPRSSHGNYPVDQSGRPYFEADIRAIPGRQGNYIATAAAHHGQAFGSLVYLNTNIKDDDRMSQVRRITPEATFPETRERGQQYAYHNRYATAWPLSESYYLYAYDPGSRLHGLYLGDRFGNRELLYRHESVPSMSPIPLRPRPVPLTIPRAAQTAAEAARAPQPATIAVLNIYESDFVWPANTQITAMRIIQILPKTTPVMSSPPIGVHSAGNARMVLGTVPVEPDGSAYFEVPAGKPIYFQALDKRGLAVQSMRSATYVQPGEQLRCVGCHEHKHRAPTATAANPAALRRPASSISPEPQGSRPFNYAVLVQPVLDRHCVACHVEKKALDLSGLPGKYFTRSYESLTDRKMTRNGSALGGGTEGSRTLAGKYGARGSKLLALLDKGHHDVKLPPEDLRRITLWMDCNSDFFGAYHDIEAQLKGELIKPALE